MIINPPLAQLDLVKVAGYWQSFCVYVDRPQLHVVHKHTENLANIQPSCMCLVVNPYVLFSDQMVMKPTMRF